MERSIGGMCWCGQVRACGSCTIPLPVSDSILESGKGTAWFLRFSFNVVSTFILTVWMITTLSGWNNWLMLSVAQSFIYFSAATYISTNIVTVCEYASNLHLQTYFYGLGINSIFETPNCVYRGYTSRQCLLLMSPNTIASEFVGVVFCWESYMHISFIAICRHVHSLDYLFS